MLCLWFCVAELPRSRMTAEFRSDLSELSRTIGQHVSPLYSLLALERTCFANVFAWIHVCMDAKLAWACD